MRNLLSYVKENHGGIFRKLAFSCMLEPLIKLNQDLSAQELKLKELDVRLNELDKFKTLATSLKEAQQLRQLQSKPASVSKQDTTASFNTVGPNTNPQEFSEDVVFVESKAIKISGHEQNKVCKNRIT